MARKIVIILEEKDPSPRGRLLREVASAFPDDDIHIKTGASEAPTNNKGETSQSSAFENKAAEAIGKSLSESQASDSDLPSSETLKEKLRKWSGCLTMEGFKELVKITVRIIVSSISG